MFSFSWRKFLAFEWIMFLLVGCFWASAVSFPLYLIGAFKNPEALPKYIAIMAGPYVVYLFFRLIWLLGKSIWWAYWTEELFFRHWAEKRFAKEWLRVAVFGFCWALVAVWPMLYFKMFLKVEHIFSSIIVLFFPYLTYLVSKVMFILFGSIRWAILELMDAPEAKLKRK